MLSKPVRTTVTLDADTERLLRKAMRERNVTFKAALNDAVRRGLGKRASSGSVVQPDYRPARLTVPAGRQWPWNAALGAGR